MVPRATRRRLEDGRRLNRALRVRPASPPIRLECPQWCADPGCVSRVVVVSLSSEWYCSKHSVVR